MAHSEARESARDRENDPTSVRTLPALDAKLIQVDVSTACEQLRQEERWRTTGRNAMTVVKYSRLRVVLEIMRPGAQMEDAHPATSGDVVIQVLSGHLQLDVDGQTLDVDAGRLVALDGRVPSVVRALDESAFLIWVSWSESEVAG